MKPVTNARLKKQISKFDFMPEGNTLKERRESAYKVGDNILDPSLLLDKRRFFSGAGIDIEDYVEAAWGYGTPIKGQGILPHKGTNNILVLVFGSPMDGHPEQTIDAVERAFNGFGNSLEYPYESVRNYYLRSSYGKCRFHADVYGWIPWPETPYGWYTDGENWWWQSNIQGAHDTFQRFLNNHPDLVAEIDWAKYDNDHDGYIEGLYLIWNWYDLGWGSQWWPQMYPMNTGYFGPFYVDGKIIGTCVWSWYSRLNSHQFTYDPHTDIHETGHLLGLPDLYDYSTSLGPKGGVGGLDMMDFNWGDHNAWHKFLLNWIRKPRLIFPFRNATPENIELHPSSTHPEMVIIMPNSTKIDPYNDLFIVQYRKKGVGNDPEEVIEGTEDTWPFPGTGLLIHHVDSTVIPGGTAFTYNNSYTNHKYLKLMEADGLNRIETVTNYLVTADDFYQEGDIFDDNSTPNAWLYNLDNGGEGRCPSGVIVDQIGPSGGDTITARFQIKKS